MIKSKHKSAFSLAELLVVIAIIGILAGFAIPAYNSYVKRANMAKGFDILKSMAKQAVAEITKNEGVVMGSLSYGDVTIAKGEYKTTKLEPFRMLHYGQQGGPDMWFCGVLNNMGLTDQVTGTTGTDGTNTRICTKAYLVNNSYHILCGTWQQAPVDAIPQDLPEGCKCLDLQFAYADANCS